MGAEHFAVKLGQDAYRGLTTFIEHLETWNERFNLVGPQDRSQLIQRHVVDCFAPIPLLVSEPAEARIVDIGSGGGLPGMPLAIVNEARQITMIEPRRKRANFLRTAIRECSTWNTQVHCQRVEEFAREKETGFDIAISRATVAPRELPAKAADVVRPGGLLVAFSTSRQAELLADYPGYARPEPHEYSLPGVGSGFRLTAWRRL